MTDATPEIRFAIAVDGQAVNVRFKPRRFAGYGQFEFTGSEEGKRIPMSQTGYQSHFSPMWEIEAAPGIEAYARELARFLAHQQRRPQYADEETEGAPAQLALF